MAAMSALRTVLGTVPLKNPAIPSFCQGIFKYIVIIKCIYKVQKLMHNLLIWWIVGSARRNQLLKMATIMCLSTIDTFVVSLNMWWKCTHRFSLWKKIASWRRQEPQPSYWVWLGNSLMKIDAHVSALEKSKLLRPQKAGKSCYGKSCWQIGTESCETLDPLRVKLW